MTPITPPTLDEVHLWMLHLHRQAGNLNHSHRPSLRTRRAAVIPILARYLHTPPDRLTLLTGPFGKPTLAPPSTFHPQLDLRFNLSHAPGLTLLALTIGREIGVDLESLRHPPRTLDGILRYLHPREQAALSAFTCRPNAANHQRLLRCWTCKEAYVKGIGWGLRLPLNRFEVCCDPCQPPALLQTPPGISIAWSLHELPLPSGFVGTLAIHGRLARLRCFTDDV